MTKEVTITDLKNEYVHFFQDYGINATLKDNEIIVKHPINNHGKEEKWNNIRFMDSINNEGYGRIIAYVNQGHMFKYFIVLRTMQLDIIYELEELSKKIADTEEDIDLTFYKDETYKLEDIYSKISSSLSTIESVMKKIIAKDAMK